MKSNNVVGYGQKLATVFVVSMPVVSGCPPTSAAFMPPFAFAPWRWDGGPAVLQSRAWDEAGNAQPTRAEIVARRGETTAVPNVLAFPTQHYNTLTSWGVDRSGEVKHVYA